MSSQETAPMLSPKEARSKLLYYYLTVSREEVDELPSNVRYGIACHVRGYAAALREPADETLDELMEELGEGSEITP
ncbi:MAG: hypothetical protein OXB91_05375 [Bryobacterales bacterium]|nr:hypothetical protein [Bryobacterales bacterium]